MNKKEYLLTILAEECAEVIELCSKIMRFGSDNVAPDETEDNKTRLENELNDVFGVVALLQDDKIINEKTLQGIKIKAKKDKVKRYYKEYESTLDNKVYNMFDDNLISRY